ncbi:omega-hydroxypalmitate O-feruloyl transferase-like [Vigna unguiculata]|uniref:omega-hydroxypalmitate O-feruloyl transferase-like n=1 Tax=Vigna unguiculata TaxID=3917 RepID=UPI001016B278|nr:omega-hydroxypalmitate O-feruloyl transferase-like [Vigna unguiculata]
MGTSGQKSASPLSDLKVTIHETSTIFPSKQTEKKCLFLSNIDKVVNFDVETLHFFAANKAFSLQKVAEKLKKALEDVLVHYSFLAGRLRQNAETKRLEIDCNAKGAAFVVASCKHKLSELGDLAYPNPAFAKLVHKSKDKDLPLAVQLTSFDCGGFAMGFTTSHAAFDGLSFKTFLDNLAALAANKPMPVMPCHDRHLLAARSPPRVTFAHPELAELDYSPIASTESNVFDASKGPKSNFFDVSKGPESNVFDASKGTESNVFDASKGTKSNVFDASKGTKSNVFDVSKGTGSNVFDDSKGTESNVFDASKGTKSNVFDVSKGPESNVFDASKGTESNVFDASKGTKSNVLDVSKGPESNVFDASKGTKSNVLDVSKGPESNVFDASKGTESNVFDASKGTESNVFDASKGTKSNVFDDSKEKLDFRVFKLTPEDIVSLKEKAKGSTNDSNTGFNAITAHIWRCKALSAPYDPTRSSTVLFPVDIRSKLNPPLPEGFAGNAVLTAFATAKYEELEKGEFSRLVEMVKEGAERMNDEYVRSVIDRGELCDGFPRGDVLVSSWQRLGFEKVEYPWGKPKYCCPVVHQRKEIIHLFPPFVAGGDDGINLIVALPPKKLEKFENLFHTFLRSV